MPPKKKKAAASKKRKVEDDNDTATTTIPSHMWLLTVVIENRGDTPEQVHGIFSSKEKAIAAMPALLDTHCPHSTDWRNGLEGFGQEDEDNYLEYEYEGGTIDEDGVLIGNRAADSSDVVEVKLQYMAVDSTIESPPPGGSHATSPDFGSSCSY